jgi:hypothetical protein
MNQWPKDTMAAKIEFYGDPGPGPDDADSAWKKANLIPVVPPFRMTFEGKPIKSITFHKKCAAALAAALDAIWVACGKDQAKIEELGLQEFGGSFNYRKIRGRANLFNHSFGIAVDIAPTGNELGRKKGTMPAFAVTAFKDQGARWGGDYKKRKDWMHFEFVS